MQVGIPEASPGDARWRFMQVMENSTGWTLKQVATSIILLHETSARASPALDSCEQTWIVYNTALSTAFLSAREQLIARNKHNRNTHTAHYQQFSLKKRLGWCWSRFHTIILPCYSYLGLFHILTFYIKFRSCWQNECHVDKMRGPKKARSLRAA
jgi:hypothetical protein